MEIFQLILIFLLLNSCGATNNTESDEEFATAILNGDVSIDFSMHHTRANLLTGEFEELAPPPSKRHLMSHHLVDGKIYLLGGVNEQGNYVGTLEEYDPSSNQWRELASRPDPGFTFDHVLGDLICGIGGFDTIDSPARRSVDCYDTNTDEWSTKSEIPSEYFGFSSVAYNGEAYIVGGLDSGYNPIPSTWKFNPQTDTWTQLQTAPMNFYSGATKIVNGKIYLVGGFKSNYDDAQESQTNDQDLLIYDIASDNWSTGSSMPNSRFLYGSATLGDKLCVYLGIRAESVPTIEIYDPASNIWTSSQVASDELEGFIFTSVKTTNEFYLFGIQGDQKNPLGKSSGDLYRYNSNSDELELIGTRSGDLSDAAFVGTLLGDHIYFSGTHTEASIGGD